MAKFPHIYKTISSSTKESLLNVELEGRDSITTSAPVGFGGPEGHWTPEDFFSASVSSCFILTFKFVSKTKKLDWNNLTVEVDALLDRTADGLCFNKVVIRPKLEICCEKSVDPFLEALHEAEKGCLITNSINSEIVLEPKIILKAKN